MVKISLKVKDDKYLVIKEGVHLSELQNNFSIHEETF
jgi:hypothetical protein